MESIAALREKCQKDKLQSNTGLTLLNRRLSIYVTRLILQTRLTPAKLTMLNIMLGLLGAGCFVVNTWHFNMLGIALLYASFLFDQVDGEVARYYGVPAFNLLYLDEIRHLVIYPVPVFCLAFPAFHDTNSLLMFALGFVSAVVLALTRVNERVALLIYMDRAVLRSHFRELDLIDYLARCNGSVEEDKPVAAESTGDKTGLVRWVVKLLYSLSHFFCDQAAILLCLLAVTLLDLMLPRVSGLAYQTWFLIVFSILVPAVYARTVYSWCKERHIRKQCTELNQRMLARISDLAVARKDLG